MKHLKRKLMMTLALLLTVATGAWATAPTVYESGQTVNKNDLKVGDIILGGVTINGTNDGGYITMIAGRYSSDGDILSFNSDVNRYPITVNADGSWKHPNATWVFAPIDASGQAGNAWEVTAKTENGSDYDVSIVGIQYGSAAATPVPLTWDAATPNTATLTNGMPAGNVTVSVEYFPQAELAMSTGETPMALAPTAIADVPANTDAPIVTPGTVANIGTSEVKQGTLMYFVSQSTGNTAPDAPDYDDDGWTDKVPTADGLAQGDAYVWYYIKGAEPANIADRTDDNTRSDSDIKPLGTDGIVTLAAEPTYDVSLNQTGMAEGEPAKWSAKSTNVTTAVNLGEADLKGVKKGETVTVTYTGSKKVLGVKAEKKAAPKLLEFEPMGVKFYYYEGETWGEAIQNHPENKTNGWYIEEFGITVMYGGRALCDSAHDDDITKETKVNPNGGYLWGPEP